MTKATVTLTIGQLTDVLLACGRAQGKAWSSPDRVNLSVAVPILHEALRIAQREAAGRRLARKQAAARAARRRLGIEPGHCEACGLATDVLRYWDGLGDACCDGCIAEHCGQAAEGGAE